ncbi:MAG TPA: co-chaperone GroES [Candidatus Pacebacteria bacterium]|nr:co-chaperone GroES [Candidatus Paceibacterota bacterium]
MSSKSSKLSISQLQPLAGFVLVEPAEKETQTASGLILPGSDSEKPQHGQVLAVGGAVYQDGREIVAPVKKGDQVLYKKWGGNDVTIDDTEYQFLKFEDILAVVKA